MNYCFQADRECLTLRLTFSRSIVNVESSPCCMRKHMQCAHTLLDARHLPGNERSLRRKASRVQQIIQELENLFTGSVTVLFDELLPGLLVGGGCAPYTKIVTFP